MTKSSEVNIEPPCPRAFISHATEDKERFVLNFAAELRANGVDAWLDQWEIRPGESLVQRIFTDGIDQADVFIVVISATSAKKPWVREELDAGMVRKITGQCRLIPVVLDSAAVPAALRHLLYVDVDRMGRKEAIAAVLRTIHNEPTKPPIGGRPEYVTSATADYPDPIDALVARAVVAEVRAARRPTSEGLHALLQDAGLTPGQVDEGVELLEEQGMVNVQRHFGGGYLISDVDATFWLKAEEQSGLDVGSMTERVLAHLANNRVLAPGDLPDIHGKTVSAVVDLAENQGLVRVSRSATGHVHVTYVSPRLSRQLRE